MPHGASNKKKKRVVLRIGGSVLGSPPQASLLSEYSEVILEALRRPTDDGRATLSIGVVVGGGPIARTYIATAKELSLPPEEQDMIAIQASRLNARLVAMKLGIKRVSTTIEGMVAELERNGIAVMGGLRRGITTDTVAAILGEAWHSDLLVKASDQDGVYTADPRSDREAKLLHALSFQQLVGILGGEQHSPGIHSIVDPVAARLIARNKLALVVTNGFSPSNVRRALLGERVGTQVS